MDTMVHLHVHTSYSFLDGMCKPEDLLTRAKELGMQSIAITDHNHIGGCYEFQKQCHTFGIKPILGVEAYYTDDMSILSLPVEQRTAMAAKLAYRGGLITRDEYITTKLDVVQEKFKKKLKALLVDKKKKYTKKELKEKIKSCMYPTKQFHIILLATNQTGWKNLVKLESEAARL